MSQFDITLLPTSMALQNVVGGSFALVKGNMRSAYLANVRCSELMFLANGLEYPWLVGVTNLCLFWQDFVAVL